MVVKNQNLADNYACITIGLLICTLKYVLNAALCPHSAPTLPVLHTDNYPNTVEYNVLYPTL